MSAPAEVTALHARLLKSGLDVEDARAFWARPDAATAPAAEAFERYWFGARSLPRVEEKLSDLRFRFGAAPDALAVLHAWPGMDAPTRRLICHWHLQLSDPLYRRFTGALLVERRAAGRPDIGRDVVVRWVEAQAPGRWAAATRIQFASKLLSAAYAAGLVAGRRDPRPLAVPPVPDLALEYLLHLLRGLAFEGGLLANPYLASVGLLGDRLEARLAGLPSLAFRRQGRLVELDWRHSDLAAWGAARAAAEPAEAAPALVSPRAVPRLGARR